MIDLSHVSDLVRDVARLTPVAPPVEDVWVRASVDSLGDDSLWITVVTPDSEKGRRNGEAILQLIDGVATRLEQQGDHRFPYISIGTREELTEDVDSES